MYGPDGVSNVMLGASDSVAGFNSTQAGGNLPGNMRFARLDYAAVTELPTLLWLWRFVVDFLDTFEPIDWLPPPFAVYWSRLDGS